MGTSRGLQTARRPESKIKFGKVSTLASGNIHLPRMAVRLNRPSLGMSCVVVSLLMLVFVHGGDLCGVAAAACKYAVTIVVTIVSLTRGLVGKRFDCCEKWRWRPGWDGEGRAAAVTGR